MSRTLRPDAVFIQAVIAGALSFAHLHDLAEAAGQDGWKAWAYPVSVDLLLVAAWRRMRTDAENRDAWLWFAIALVASLGANIATAGLLDLNNVPAWLRILVAGWPALAFLGGTLLAHAPAAVREPEPIDQPHVEPTADVTVERAPEPAPELPPADPAPQDAPPQPAPTAPAVPVPPALLDHAQKIADAHQAQTGARSTRRLCGAASAYRPRWQTPSPSNSPDRRGDRPVRPNRFHNVIRIGPVRVGTHHDGRGRTRHTAVCTAPGCDFSADYLTRAAAELAARTHRCNPR